MRGIINIIADERYKMDKEGKPLNGRIMHLSEEQKDELRSCLKDGKLPEEVFGIKLL